MSQIVNLKRIINGVEEQVYPVTSVDAIIGYNGPINPSLEGYATEQWVKDQGFLTEHQDISHLAEKNNLGTASTKNYNTDFVHNLEVSQDGSINSLKSFAGSVILPVKADSVLGDVYFSYDEGVDQIKGNIFGWDQIAQKQMFPTTTYEDVPSSIVFEFNEDIAGYKVSAPLLDEWAKNVDQSLQILGSKIDSKIDFKIAYLDADKFNSEEVGSSCELTSEEYNKLFNADIIQLRSQEYSWSFNASGKSAQEDNELVVYFIFPDLLKISTINIRLEGNIAYLNVESVQELSTK